MKALVIGAMALSLAGCQSTQVAKIEAIKTKADTQVSVAARKLADYCALVQIGLTSLQAFNTNPKVQQVLSYAQPSVAAYCAGPPPENVEQALAKLVQIYSSVVNAQAKVGA